MKYCRLTILFILVVAGGIIFISGTGVAEEKRWEPQVKCHMTFSLKSWSVFYKRSKGTGVVDCDNGQRAKVKISAHEGGVTFGKSKIVNGKGTFSKVDDISQLFGSYATSDAHAGAKKSAGAHAMTKGNISLALSGTGKGYDLGFAFGKFKITKMK